MKVLSNLGIGTNPNAPLDISYNQGTFSATGNTHLQLTNPASTGQSPLDYVINGTLRGRIRTDYVGNLNYVTNGGSHYWWYGGDSTVGTVGMLLDTSGNLGIGTTPIFPLDVGIATGNTVAKFGDVAPVCIIKNDPCIGFNICFNAGWLYNSSLAGCVIEGGGGNFNFLTAPAGTAGTTASMTSRMYIGNTGSVGINQSSPACSLDVGGCIRSTSGSAATPNSGTGLELYYDTTNNEGVIRVYNESAISSPYYKPLLLDGSSIALNDISSGQVGVCCSPSYTLDVNGTVHYVTLAASSDERFKKNIEPVTSVLPDIMKLEPIKFEWNETINEIRDGYRLGEPTYGFIAQQVKDVFPELVSQWKASDDIPDAHSLSYERMVPLLVGAIQELYRLVSAERVAS
jgi:hypothetical protein